MSEIDKILDPDNTETIVLYDEDNQSTEFEQIAVIPLEEEVYVILQPVEGTPGVEKDEAWAFRIDEVDGEDALILLNDKKTINRVFEEYYRLMEEDGDTPLN